MDYSEQEALSEASFFISCESFNKSRLPHAQTCYCGYHDYQRRDQETASNIENRSQVSRRSRLLFNLSLSEITAKLEAQERAEEEYYWKALIEATNQERARERAEQETFNKAYPQWIKCSGALTGGLPNPCDTCKVQPCDYKEA